MGNLLARHRYDRFSHTHCTPQTTSPVSVQEDGSVSGQSEFLGNPCPQSFHRLSPGHSEFQRTTGGGGDGQTHGEILHNRV